MEQDLIYVIAPPNSLVKEFVKYRKKTHLKVIIDIYDLWPESMPLEKVKKVLAFPLVYWRELRDKNLKYADLVITECDLYQEILKKELVNSNTGTVYLTRNLDAPIEISKKISIDIIQLAYLGSINNIINIELILQVLLEIQRYKKVILHIIGNGENKQKFLESLDSNHIEYIYYGEIYDAKKQKEIFNKCLFGINLMKSNVCVGLTMKSLDYFKFGLPILNNIQGDTKKLVEERNIGYNLKAENIKEIAKKISGLSKEEILTFKENTKEVFYDLFSNEMYDRKMDELISKIDSKK
ncbi:MAG: glycosyltransferase [Clostridia bacterium]